MCRGARAAPGALLLPVSALLSLSPCPSAVHVHGPSLAPKPYRERLKNIDDLQYHSSVRVGDQVLSSVIDSGSTELVVISDVCKSWCGSLSHLYHVHNRTTSIDDANNWTTLSYGSGSLVVEQQTSGVRIGPYSTRAQQFWQVVDANMPLLGTSEFAVIMGLGPQDPGDMKNSRGIPNRLGIRSFGFCIEQAKGQPGYMTWNDDAHVASPKNFIAMDVVGSGYWMVTLKNVRVGKTMIACRKGCGAIFDSGTSLIGAPPPARNKIHANLKKLKADCGAIDKMPPLTFELADKTFSLPPDAYIGVISKDTTSAADTLKADDSAAGPCEPAILPVSLGSDLGEVWILGMPFFRFYYTIFTLARKPQIFVSKATKNCRPSSGRVGNLFNIDIDTNVTSRARRIVIDKVFQPLWLQKAIATHRLDEHNASSVNESIGGGRVDVST